MPSSLSVRSVLLSASAPLKIQISCFIQFLPCLFFLLPMTFKRSLFHFFCTSDPSPELDRLCFFITNTFLISFLKEKEVSSFLEEFGMAGWAWLASRNNMLQERNTASHPVNISTAPSSPSLRTGCPAALYTTGTNNCYTTGSVWKKDHGHFTTLLSKVRVEANTEFVTTI